MPGSPSDLAVPVVPKRHAASATRAVARPAVTAGLCHNPGVKRTVGRTESVAHALRDAILAGDLPPGTHLREAALAAQLGAGRYTLRAAFGVLAAEGLVTLERNRGAFVAIPAADATRDLHRFRAALEQGALGVALARGASLDAVGAAVDELGQLADDAPWPRVADAHHAIHAAIVAAAGSARLDAAYDALRTELLFVVTRIRPSYTLARMVEVHRRLHSALESGDAARAAAALERDLDEGLAAMEAAAEPASTTVSPSSRTLPPGLATTL